MLDRTRPGAIAWDDAATGGVDPGALLSAIDAVGVGAVVGPHGSGKSTLLAHVRAAAAARGRATWSVTAPGRDERGRRPAASATAAAVRAAREAIAAAGPGDLVTQDSADRIGVLARAVCVRSARRRGVRLLLAAHRPLRVPTLHQLVVEPALARRLARGLLPAGDAFALPDESWFVAMLQAERGNLRAVFGRLYHAYERHAMESRTDEAPAAG